MKFTIPIVEKISNNKLRTVHWGTRNAITKKYINAVMETDVLVYPKVVSVNLEATFYFKNRPLDCSNCAGMVKMIEDGMVKRGMIVDDKPEIVRSVKIMSRVSKENPRIEIELK